MFSLSEAAKYNLEAIVHEFQRASQWYGPLYHERLLPWGGVRPATVTDDEWDKFIELESDKLPDNEWWEWEGPSARSPGWDASFLERWFGNPEGRNSFLNLVESTLAVLDGEDLSEIPDLEMPFDFSDAEGWTGTLHAWAFRFDMPLLRCTMKTWGQEEDEPVKLFDTANLWRHIDGGSRYPAHPIRWSLIDDVFTSSVAAIRALLRPDLVIASNEPWPLAWHYRQHGRYELNSDLRAEESGAVEVEGTEGEDLNGLLDARSHSQENTDEEHVTEIHRLIEMPQFWSVQFAGTEMPVYITQQAGLQRIAYLIAAYPNSVEPSDLNRVGGRKEKRKGRILQSLEIESTHGLTPELHPERKRQDTYDDAGVEELRGRMEECSEGIKEAEGRENAAEAEQLRREFKQIEKHLKDVLRSKTYKRAKDNVSKSIRNAVKQLEEKGQDLEAELSLLLEQIDFDSPQFRFIPKRGCTRWVVKRLGQLDRS